LLSLSLSLSLSVLPANLQSTKAHSDYRGQTDWPYLNEYA